MVTWNEIGSYLLLLLYCLTGAELLDRYVFDHELSGVKFGLLMTMVFISAYPFFGWGRTSPWVRLGRWSLEKWALVGIVVGVAATLIDVLSHVVTRHFSG